MFIPQNFAASGNRILGLFAGSVLVAALTGCAFSREFKEPEALGALPSESVPTVGAGGVGEINLARTYDVSATTFMVKSDRPQGGVLPDIYVKGLSVTESGLQDALQLVLGSTGMTLHIEGGPRALERNGSVSLHNISGSLRQVMDQLANAMGFFWSVANGVITIEPDRLFVVELPPVLSEDTLAGMTNTMQVLGAKDVYLDRMARSLVFRTNVRGINQIEQYMTKVRDSRSMVVYELQVYQVDLADATKQGIDWNKLGGSSIPRAKPANLTSPSSSGSSVSGIASDLADAFSLTQSGSGLGAVLLGPKFNLDVLVSFLKTQGTVKTVTQPRLAMLNGSKGTLRVGQSSTYVSKVGSNLSTGISQVTVETKDLRTGLELSLVGEENDNTIYTRVSLSLSELIRFQKFTALGTDLTLPEVTDRDLQTSIRLPAGYSALLGGITVSRSSAERGIGAATNSVNNEVKKSELVIVLKPTIVRFNAKPVSTVAALGESK